MALQLTNSLRRQKELFQPYQEKKVGMYVCGPTVYNFIHIGNARPLIFFDIVRRFLEFSGYEVKHIMNYTDVDDKILDRADQEKISPKEIAEKYIREYETDMKLLGVKTPNVMPRVSTHIPQIISLIERLIQNKMAYCSEGEVFYSVRSFSEYGKLSGKQVDDLMSGARVEVDAKKKDPLDFSLWKPQKHAGELAWDSPWGKGRPGWHIECSAMAMTYLGEKIDLHGGGMDLIHPHHENEIAQSEGATHQPYVKYWMHNNMLTLASEKMSKSLGNIFLTREFVTVYGAETLKFLLLSGHYRSTIDFSDKAIHDAQAGLHRIYSTVLRCEQLLENPVVSNLKTEIASAIEFQNQFESQWVLAMEDDFNTAKVMGLLFELVRLVNAALDQQKGQVTEAKVELAKKFAHAVKKLGTVLNLFSIPPTEFLQNLKSRALAARHLKVEDIERLVCQRLEAKKNKNFALADQIRNELSAQGIQLRDTATSCEWDVF